MTFCVKNPNIPDQQAPENFEGVVNLINHIVNLPERVFVQLSGYNEELVKEVSTHFNTNFFGWDQVSQTGMNPFTVIHVSQDGTIKRHDISCKSKIILYAKRPNHHH